MASSKSKLLIAFASYRDRPKHPNIFFYEHDGVAKGQIVGKVGTPRNIASAEGHPSLDSDGCPSALAIFRAVPTLPTIRPFATPSCS